MTGIALSPGSLSNPVATTTSSIALPSCGFSLVPQMMLALCTAPVSSCTLAWACMYSRICTTSSYISASVSDTEMLSRMFLAPEIRLWSSSGEWSDASAAASARLSPSAVATAMWARPLSRMTFDTSAKSTFTRSLSTVMISAMPLAAEARMSSALPKACLSESRPYISRMFSLLMTSSESTFLRSSSMPRIA